MRLDQTRDSLRGFLFIPFLLLVFTTSVSAEEQQTTTGVVKVVSVTPHDPAQEAIIRQLEAIKSRDASTAYELTTSHFHEKFDTADEFLRKIRFEHRPIYNYKDYKFLEQSVIKDDLLQKVSIQDRYGGDPILVIYRLEQQEDGAWLIDSFTVLGGDTRPI